MRRRPKSRGQFLKLDPHLWRAVRKLAKAEGVTLTAIVKSALVDLLRGHIKEVQ